MSWSWSCSRIRSYYFLILMLCLAIFIVKHSVFRSTQSDKFVEGHDRVKNSVSKQARSNPKLILHPSLYSYGRIIINYPKLFRHGGSSAMNYLHCTLVTAGFNSYMHIPNPESISENCSRFIANDFHVSSDDIVIIPELEYTTAVSSWRSTGARVVIYMLGIHLPLVQQHHTDVLWAPSSTYTRDLYLATGKQVLFAPLERHMYELQKKDLIQFSATGKEINIYRHFKSKENLIFIDNDSNFPRSLQTALSQLPLKPRVSFKVLADIPFLEVPSWFRRAKIVIDLGLPGVERINNEGALFDAIVLVANTLSGMDPTDFPIPNDFKLDTRNETQMFEVIKSTSLKIPEIIYTDHEINIIVLDCLINYETLLPQWHALKQLSLDLPRRFLRDSIPSYFSTRSFKFFLVTSSLEEESAIIPFALHCAVHHPLARIEAQVQNLAEFKRNHDMILKLLKEITNLSRDWLLLTQRSSDDKPTFINESPFIISIDPRNMIVDEQLPNILVHLLNDKSSLTLASSCFGLIAQAIGNVTIWRSDSFKKITPAYLSKTPSYYNSFLEDQLINVYAERKKQEFEKGTRLASALYATQQHKLLQSMLPLTVPRFVEVMKQFEIIYPRNLMTD